MDAKIKIGKMSLSIVDNGVYVDACSRELLEFLGLDHRIIGNEACLTDNDCRTIVSLFVLQNGGSK